MFIHTLLSAYKMFVKFECQTRTFCNTKEEKKTVSQAWVIKTLIIDYHFNITNTTAVVIRNLELLVISLGHFASWIPFYC